MTTESFFMFGYGDNQPHFCEDCGQLEEWSIQVSNYKGRDENKNVCLICTKKEMDRIKALKKKYREERKRTREKNNKK